MEQSSPARTPERAAATDRTPSAGDGDRLRHIICVRCYPAFDGVREAPSDAVCVCGKPVRAGDQRPTGDAMHCILCTELLPHHPRERHAS